MKVHCRKLTKAEAIAESKAALAKQRELMAEWQRRRDAATVEIFNNLLPQ